MQNQNNIYPLPAFKARKAVILARVSSRDQEEGYSIDAQKHRLERYCARKDIILLKTFAIVESSTNGDRKHFMELISYIRAQREPIALVADKVDRVQRSFKEYPLLDGLIQQGKLELHFNTENYVIHKDSVSQERLMWSMGVIMAQSYIDSMRDNVKRSFDQKIRMGEWIAKAPIGYLNVKDDRGRGDVVVDPVRAPLVIKLFEKYAAGAHTIPEITEYAKSINLTISSSNKPPTRAHVHKMLQNPFYYGFMSVKGQIYEHRYPPLISIDLFNRCQDVIKGWNKQPFHYGGQEFVFRGILSCATSGRTVTADTKRKTYKSGEIAEWTYLVCWNPEYPDKKMWVREDRVLLSISDILKKLTVPPHVMDEIREYLSTTDHAERTFLRRQIGEWQREYTVCQSRLDRLTDLLLDGVIEREEFHGKKVQIRKQQLELERRLNEAREGDDNFKEIMLNLLDIASEAHNLFERSTIERKRQLLNFVFSNLQLEGEKLRYSLRKPFDQMLELTNCQGWLNLIDELRTLDLMSIQPELRCLRSILSGLSHSSHF